MQFIHGNETLTLEKYMYNSLRIGENLIKVSLFLS